MATPRVFISSTCYDLKHVRESLKYFVKSIGYEPVLSEDGDVFYSPSAHTHDSCLEEVSTCQIFVLIIGGRYGGIHQETDKSITNEEYLAAIGNGIPVFTLVDAAVHADHHLYTSNRNNSEIDREKINYPASDSIQIFSFIDDVRKHSINNAIQPFKNFSDIELYLKKQWAGMMFELLQKSKNDTQSRVTQKLLSDLSLASKKTEELIKFLVNTADKDNAKAVIDKIDLMAEAQKFPSFVMQKWSIDSFNDASIDRLLKVPIEQKWYEYLQDAFGFSLDRIEEHNDIVLWSPDEVMSRRGIVIGSLKEGQDEYHEMPVQEAFDAFASLNSDDKRAVLMKFINGI